MSEVRTIGLDLAKNVFQVHGADASGAVVFRKQLRRVLLQILDMVEKEPFRICGQKAAARAWNCTASDGGDR